MRKTLLIAAALLLIAVPAFSKDAAPVPLPQKMKQDLARFDQKTNADRAKVLKTMLDERHIPCETEEFANTSSTKDTRPTGNNVIASLGSGAEDIVVCAHYDAAKLRSGELSKGMLDNAASVVVLIRVAESLKDARLKHRVRFLFADMEELRGVGSGAYVTKHKSDKIAAAVNLDMITTGTTVGYGRTDDTRSALLHRTAKDTCEELKVSRLEFRNYPPGDDASFRKAGIPCISMCVIPDDEAHMLWRMMNPSDKGTTQMFSLPTIERMHTEQDTPDAVSEDAMTTAYRVLREMVLKLDSSQDQ